MPSKEKAADLPAKEESLYINRELSWLSFNERVLLEAADTTVPLLERLKFLMIYQSNLEEFYRVRIGILTHRTLLTPDKRDPVSGMLAEETIQEVLRITREQQSLAESVWKAIRTELKRSGVEVLNFNKIGKVDELMAKKLFGDIKNLLFPKIIDPDQALPFFWGEESYVVAFLGKTAIQKLAIIPMHRVPAYLSFEIDGVQKIVLTDQLVRRFLPLLLKKENILQSAVVKVTRNADVFLSQMAGKEDLREKTSNMLSKRKRETPVRAQIYGKLTDPARAMLVKKLRVPEQRVFSVSIPFDLSFRSCIGYHDNFRYEDRKPARDVGLKKGEYFRYIEKHDLLMSFPFQSMMPFVDLIYEAADDPEVLSIKITLYRMSASSKIAAALAYAADRGKDVLCLLELRARFDEQNNIDYSEMLEDAGCRIIYGLPDHKVHSKLCLITRQHGGNIETVTQVGTGNYNEITGEQYTDLSLITSDPEAGKDAEATFRALEQSELPPEAHSLWIAPRSFKSRVIEYLDREIAKGERGRVSIKCNAMNNLDIMEKLIECSQAGVKVELFIRGICCLRPGIPGKTENITVRSVVGRWLEHSRVYCFGEGEDERLFIGSGDLLNRNLERRVEAFVEIRTPETREQIHEILNALRDDREKSRTMQPDGSYLREPNGEGTSSQERLYQYFSRRKVSLLDEPERASAAEAGADVQVRGQTAERKPESAWAKFKKLFQ
ncbi:MAG: polyphosphate kinase 1 [Oscillospiraceae bacterium]|nr:polyphosphate kinase 1 [Oscillospiraceae bacterium]